MSARRLLLAGMCAVALAAAHIRAQTPAGRPLVFDHVNVVDVTTGNIARDRRVIISGDRIRAISPATGAAPRGAQVVDGTGKYLIPGLWDMHVHVVDKIAEPDIYGDVLLPLYLANGVTGLRDMGSTVANLIRWRDLAKRGAVLPLRMVFFGPIIEPKSDPSPRFWHAHGPAEVRRAVDSLARLHVDFIKVFTGPSAEEFHALADEAKRVGLPFAGHLPVAGPSLADVSNAGMRSIEHHFGPLLGGSPREDEIRRYAARVMDTIATASGAIAFIRTLELMADSTFDERRADSVYRILAKNGTFFTPTMTISHYVRTDTVSLGADLREWNYLPGAVQEAYRSAVRPGQAVTRPSQTRQPGALNFLARQERTFKLMRGAGVDFLAGTDNAPVIGFSAQHELEWLVRVGLTPLEALQAGTINPAKSLRATDSLGTVSPGKLADLVLLDANPLDDISNTQRIRAVTLGGTFYDRAALDSLLRLPRQLVPDARR